MIQIAILAVLVLIALMLAPWLIGLFAVAVALYGVYLVLLGAAVAVAVVVALVWVLIGEVFSQKDGSEVIAGERKACPSCSVEMSVNDSYCRNCGTTS